MCSYAKDPPIFGLLLTQSHAVSGPVTDDSFCLIVQDCYTCTLRRLFLVPWCFCVSVLFYQTLQKVNNVGQVKKCLPGVLVTNKTDLQLVFLYIFDCPRNELTRN